MTAANICCIDLKGDSSLHNSDANQIKFVVLGNVSSQNSFKDATLNLRSQFKQIKNLGPV